MKLIDLCLGIRADCLKGTMEAEIRGIAYDSRKVERGTVFVCLAGTESDGHDYITESVDRGAAAVVIEKAEKVELIPEEVTVLLVISAREALACLSAAFFGHPARKLTMIGITGTNGKTTTACMIREILEKAGKKTGMIGTMGAFIGSERIKLKNTTPESWEIHCLLAKMVDEGCQYAVMEVSSQGLKLKRTAGILFDYGVFTNLSQDHISPSEHHSFEEYLECKSILFRQCRVGIVNRDDPWHQRILEGHSCQIKKFSAEPLKYKNETVDLQAVSICLCQNKEELGSEFYIRGIMGGKIKLSMPGRFFVYDALAAILVCRLIGIRETAILHGLRQVQVKGRMERLKTGKDYEIVIDYAHNRVSVKKALNALLQYQPKRLICLFGCGGNRAKDRRYAMGEVAGALADCCVLTCDNPRFERVEDINKDIIAGIQKSNGSYVEISDRKAAIEYCMQHAEKGDMIVLLGKGHEDYQEIDGMKYEFDERKVVQELL
ncbi:MAG: UDP-N-acetylmuramoyl-L-alanyl-D-glutamate--2,6-diaminopimelate ligase [Clostridiales bacterium]|nr:UDP-N-acetylmuramoyl-L-alanyl-D-glutamate--2,6-diaminopimelate ligase [Clostridiales bacterium]